MNKKRKIYTYDEKRRIIKLYKVGFSIDQLHKLYTIPESTLNGWVAFSPYIEISNDEKQLLQDFRILFEKTQLH